MDRRTRGILSNLRSEKILRDYNPLTDCVPALDELVDLAEGDIVQVTAEAGEWKRGSLLRCEAKVYEVPVELATPLWVLNFSN